MNSSIFSLARSTAEGYIQPCDDFPDFRAGREGSPVYTPFTAHRRGQSLKSSVQPLNDERRWVLCGNHIYVVMTRKK